MAFVAVTMPIVLPWPLQSSLEAAARALLEPGDRSHIDFSRPIGEAALISPDSVSWRVFKNPLSLFIGGVTAVLMELAEPRVRTGVWEHTTFRLNPIRRLRRTEHRSARLRLRRRRPRQTCCRRVPTSRPLKRQRRTPPPTAKIS